MPTDRRLIEPGRVSFLLLEGPKVAHAAVRRHSRRLLRLALALIFLSPSLFALVYFGAVATDRYVSEASFVVRSSTKSAAGSGIAAMLRLVGASPVEGDEHAVLEYMTSPDAFRALDARLNLRQIYGHPEADALARYPNIVFGNREEPFHNYLRNRIFVSLNTNTGISKLRVEAFVPDDSQRIAKTLIEQGEEFVNAMNERVRHDTVKFAESEVALARERLKQSEVAVTAFRNREALIDPSQNSTVVLQLIAQLSARLNAAEVRNRENTEETPLNPQSDVIKQQIAAIRAQIAAEKSRLTSGDEALASKISEYEKLMLDRQFASDAMTQALQSLEQAKAEARRQQMYLETIVEPGKPDSATAPYRLFEASSIIALNLIMLLVGWLLKNGIAEHAPRAAKKGP